MVDSTLSKNKKIAKRAAPKPKKAAAPSKKVKLIKLDSNVVISDIQKKKWTLGKLLGQGGFGQVYEATCIENASKDLDKFHCPFAVKLEPSNNGALFTEIAFYQRVCRIEKIDEYVKKNKLNYLAIPYYITSGMSQIDQLSYRFLVFPQLGVDIESIWHEFDRKFSLKTICHIGLKMIDALAFIHTFGYTHGDMKASNILCDFTLPTHSGKIFLTDYGLTSLYVDSTTTFKHKPYKEFPKLKHNGTIELTSCDAHRGVASSRRSDLEILGFMLLRFFVSELLWEPYITNADKVAQLKFDFAENTPKELSKMIKTKVMPDKLFYQTMNKLFDLIYQLDYEQKPNYELLKSTLKKMITLKVYKSLNDDILFEHNS